MKMWQVLIIFGIAAVVLLGWAVAYHYDRKDKR